MEKPGVNASLADFIFFLTRSHSSFFELLLEAVLGLGSEPERI